jgi:hypothetical protein
MIAKVATAHFGRLSDNFTFGVEFDRNSTDLNALTVLFGGVEVPHELYDDDESDDVVSISAIAPLAQGLTKTPLLLVYEGDLFVSFDIYKYIPSISYGAGWTGKGFRRGVSHDIPVKIDGFHPDESYVCHFVGEMLEDHSVEMVVLPGVANKELAEVTCTSPQEWKPFDTRLHLTFSEGRRLHNHVEIKFVGHLDSLTPEKAVNTGGDSVHIHGSNIEAGVNMECQWSSGGLDNYEVLTQATMVEESSIVCPSPPWRLETSRHKVLNGDEGRAILTVRRKNVILTGPTLVFNFYSIAGGGVFRLAQQSFRSFEGNPICIDIDRHVSYVMAATVDYSMPQGRKTASFSPGQKVATACFKTPTFDKAGPDSAGKVADANETRAATTRATVVTFSLLRVDLNTEIGSPQAATISICPTGSQHLGDMCMPCPRGWANNGSSLSCMPCPTSTYSEFYSTEVCTRCYEHSTTSGVGATSIGQCKCSAGFYPSGVNQCLPCAGGVGEPCVFYRDGGDLMLPPGWWMDPSEGPYPTPRLCKQSNLCRGGSINATNGKFGKCTQGYAKRLCSGCAEGFHHMNSHCIECPSYKWVIAIAIPSLFLFICFVFLFTGVSSRTSTASNIIFNSFQFIASCGTLRATWPLSVRSLLNGLTAWNFNIDILSVECAVPLNFIDRVNVYMVGPVVMLFVLWFLFGVVRCCCYCCCCCSKAGAPSGTVGKEDAEVRGCCIDRSELKARAVRASCIILQYSYIVVSLHILSGFKCIKSYADDHDTLLAMDLSISCNSNMYKEYYPVLVIGTILYPIGCFLALICYLRKGVGSVLYAHLTALYTERFHRWEMILMMKRLSVVLTLTLLNGKFTPIYQCTFHMTNNTIDMVNIDIQLLLIMLITFLYIVLLLYSSPYKEDRMNLTAAISNMTQFMVAFAGLVFFLSHKANLCVDTNLERSVNVSKGAAFMEVFLFVFLTFVLLWFVWAYMKSIGGVFHRCCVRKPKFRQLDSDDIVTKEASGVALGETQFNMDKSHTGEELELTLSV